MDLTLLRQRIAMVGVVGLYWFIVGAAPFVAVGAIVPGSTFRGADYAFAAAIVGYCGFTGYRAWRRGWKTRFILRVIVPAALLVLSCAVAAVGSWNGWF